MIMLCCTFRQNTILPEDRLPNVTTPGTKCRGSRTSEKSSSTRFGE
ncbi:hypothetical protein AVDCRST_MAG82-1289 [uncultured Rubrobacteraceae bacterium]|uniref:Uncharacterized protein n=1 Tax=uncultured Rubrobacteraceae bacterium TaxID=349277 RepID=A0A6J4PN56_9ACTN|nr:hypothetical protein AVDCRST_MAG82-1289 [uncultured Rubrobacteraceae bacterium]